ncbi:transglycosylase family protein [Streptomyces glaucescens]
MTGSAIAIPLLGATGASAASGTTWDRVAECESGGSWSANNGNGYYGGLQISQDDWLKYGGSDYAESPDMASRSQQIAVAERILADRGVGAWPTCGLLAGLDDDSGRPGVDTGLAADAASGATATPDDEDSSDSRESGLSDSSESSESTESSDSTDSSEKGGKGKDSQSSESPESSGSDATGPSSDASSAPADGSGEGEGEGAGDSSAAATKRDDSDNSGQADSSSEFSTGTGRHRGDSADEDAADARTAEPSGRHASRDAAAARDAADGSYTVRSGDSLSGIADSLELQGGWTSLYAENKKTVGADPNLIIPGQTLEVGVEPGEK